MVTTILLARHGETDWNREGRWQGWADPPLNETGRAQARELAEQLADDAVRRGLLERPAPRARDGRDPGRAARPDGRRPTPACARSTSAQWSGLTRAEIAERFPDGDRPGGETREQHSVRVLAAVERIARAHPGRAGAVVAHGGCMRALQRHLDDDVSHPIAELQRLRAPLPRRRLPTRLR